MMRIKNSINFYSRICWLHIKYQILTKTLLFFIIFPLYKLVLSYLLESTDWFTISSGDYLSFILSIQGIMFGIVTLLVLIILIGLDVNAFIIMSAFIYERKVHLTAKNLFIIAIKSVKKFIHPAGIFIMIYMAIVVPLVGIGISVSVTEQFMVPKFITDVIFKDTLYTSLYIFALVVLTFITLRYIFLFHYVLIGNQDVKEALKNSSNLMKRHWKTFIKEFFVKFGLLLIFVLTAASTICLLLLIPIQMISTVSTRRIWTVFFLMTILEVIMYFTLMTVPLICNKLTTLFYQFNKKDGIDTRTKIKIRTVEYKDFTFGKVKFKLAISLFIVIVLFVNIIFSAFTGIYFDDIFKI